MPGRSRGAGPIPATLEVTTTRRTSSAAAASTAMRGDSAFTSQTRLDRPGGHVACRVEYHLAAAEGPAERGAIEDVGADGLDLDRAEAVEAGLVPVGHAYRAEGLGRKFCQVRADESSSARNANGHNFARSSLFMPSYTETAP